MRLIIFYLTILALLASCSGIRTMTISMEAKRQLLYANQLYQQKQFSLAVQENLNIIERFPQSPEAEKALYNLGLIYTNPENPAKNYTKALEYFGMIYNNNSKSPLAQESKNWLAILVILQAQEIELDRLRKTIYNFESQVYRLKKIIQERDRLINRIEKKIEQYKQIDIELEEKERVWKK
ncbi:MAG: hypothetical protein A3G93_13505 [Nitrospinae bacterium RIFCSPLOWO2_12_FULL_45_22]|nr:MAG: hypothetical protein A3G93_13505 [Nitrospinae bacterium RIFCSPLOWO2_12_FULL_45_22]